MLTGENGILTQASTSKERIERAEAIERAKLDIMAWRAEELENGRQATVTDAQIQTILTGKDYVASLDETSFTTKEGHIIPYSELFTVTGPTGGDGVVAGEFVDTTKKDNYTDGTDTATVPAGFTVSMIPSEQTISTGLVIYEIPEDEVEDVDWTTQNEDGAYQVQTLYNQFVWIPVANGEYERDFSYPSYYDKDITYTPENSTFTDTGYLPTEIQPDENTAETNEEAERTAVMKYNGFYIARYEAGDESATSDRGSSSGTTGTLVSKQDKYVYNYIKQVDSKAKAKTMLTTNSSVKVALCSGIQWDMVMKFVDGETPALGEEYNVREMDSNRHTGSVAKTGKNQYDKVQNIYDLEGNCREWVAEKNNTSRPFVNRAVR